MPIVEYIYILIILFSNNNSIKIIFESFFYKNKFKNV